MLVIPKPEAMPPLKDSTPTFGTDFGVRRVRCKANG